MLKSIKIRLYPNKSQSKQFNELLGCCRFVYNNCLSKKIESYKNDKTNENLTSLGKYFHNELTKNPDYEWLNKHNTKVLKQSIINMLESYNNFFKHKKGFPKFKSKKDNNLSCRFPIDAISTLNDYSAYKLTLTKSLKNIKFSCSDKYINYLCKYKDGIRSATLSKTPSGKYFLSILVNSNECLELVKNDRSVGLDLGVKDFIVTSEGQVFDNLKFKKSKIKKLKRLQRQLSKKVKGSNNRNKTRIKLSILHESIKNKTNNYLHLISKQLIDENQVISIEDLNVKGMIKNHKLAESIQSLSFGRFREILTYKCDWYGRDLVVIDRFYPSSKLCSNCGYKNKDLTLNDRNWCCPVCDTNHDRDLNASININKEGLRIIGGRTTELTLVDIPLSGN